MSSKHLPEDQRGKAFDGQMTGPGKDGRYALKCPVGCGRELFNADPDRLALMMTGHIIGLHLGKPGVVHMFRLPRK